MPEEEKKAETTEAAAGSAPPAEGGGSPSPEGRESSVAVVELPPGQYFWGTGRRKSSVARVRIRPGEGRILINKRPLEEYFPVERRRKAVLGPLRATGLEHRFDVFVNVKGGGPTGQAGAVMMGLARAIVKADPSTEAVLREDGYLTRDPRMVERKKYGRHGARRGRQTSKR